MPLVVPGLMGSNDAKDQTAHWTSQLMGKTLGDKSNETTFARNDLPKQHRVLQPDSMKTMDHNPDRLNVHVDDKGTVTKVTHG